MLWYVWVILVVAVLGVMLLVAGYLKAPPDTAFIKLIKVASDANASDSVNPQFTISLLTSKPSFSISRIR